MESVHMPFEAHVTYGPANSFSEYLGAWKKPSTSAKSSGESRSLKKYQLNTESLLS